MIKNAEAPGGIGEAPTAIVGAAVTKYDLSRQRQAPAQLPIVYEFAEVVLLGPVIPVRVAPE